MERLFINGQYVDFGKNVRIVASWAKAVRTTQREIDNNK